MLRYSHILVLLCALFFGCKKYPEDHRISLKTPFKRLTNKDWKLEKLLINDADSTLQSNYIGDIINFSREKQYHNDQDYYLMNKLGKNVVNFWRFESNNTNKIRLASGQTKTYCLTETYVWTILKLTKEEFVIKAEHNGKNVRVEFKEN